MPATDKSEQNAKQQSWKWAHGVIQPLMPWQGKLGPVSR
jgi:hypothetical protein